MRIIFSDRLFFGRPVRTTENIILGVQMRAADAS
jgi:hypothetical protein